MTQASLTVVGTGIHINQVTLEARDAIRGADRVLYLVVDPLSIHWIRRWNANAESLQPLYKEGADRGEAYQAMVDRIMQRVAAREQVCAVFYGHPGVCVFPAHEAVRRARAEGIPTRMLPGVSTDACLFADLGVDPVLDGCQSFEASRFIQLKPAFDPRVPLVLWQAGLVFEAAHQAHYDQRNLGLLVEALTPHYGMDHEVVAYVAAQYPGAAPAVKRVALGHLADSGIPAIATLYVPPASHRVS